MRYLLLVLLLSCNTYRVQKIVTTDSTGRKTVTKIYQRDTTHYYERSYPVFQNWYYDPFYNPFYRPFYYRPMYIIPRRR